MSIARGYDVGDDCVGMMSRLGVGDGSLSLVSIDLVSNSLGFLACLSLFSCVFVRFWVSVLISFELSSFAMVMGGVLYLGWLGKMGVYQG